MVRQVVEPPAPAEQRLKMSYDEYLAWWDEGRHGEWVDGEVIVFMPPRARHQDVLLFYAQLLVTYVRRRHLGKVIIAPFEMRLRQGQSSRQPDILFIATENLDRLSDERLEGPADLAIEIISDDSVTRDQSVKFREYAAEGVPEYIIVDPRPRRKRFNFYRLLPEGTYEQVAPDAEGRYHSIVIPGFWVKPAWLWEDPLPDPLALLAEIAPDAFGLSNGRIDGAQTE